MFQHIHIHIPKYKYNMMLSLVLLVQLLLAIQGHSRYPIARPNCPDRCGDEPVPYPFGTTKKCSLNPDFHLECRTDESGHRFLENHGAVGGPHRHRLREISLESHEATFALPGQRAEHCNKQENNLNYYTIERSSSLSVSNTKNKFIVVGCDSYGFIKGFKGEKNFSTGCMSVCNSGGDIPEDGSCSGVGCCQTDVPGSLDHLCVEAYSFNDHHSVGGFNPCTYAFIAKESEFRFERSLLANFSEREVPYVVDWVIPYKTCSDKPFCLCGRDNTDGEAVPELNGFRCKCRRGFRGNPYLANGCQTDINECKHRSLNNCTTRQRCNNTIGGYECIDIHIHQFPILLLTIGIFISLIALLVGGLWISRVLNNRKLRKLKQKFFKQNGGLLLQQQHSNFHKTCPSDTARVFTSDELSKATNNYHETRVIGQGSYGTVYKGVLSDNKAVAIKKSKIGDQSQIEKFINEVIVLSQINHRNVVKLLGCCLETEVPLLVYEFITNGTVSEHIHEDEPNGAKYGSLSWEMRLKIATDTAGAISYLHSSACIPIIHRDIKTANILLDENYAAKVADFGASRLIPLDKAQLTTLVQGTLGYLDPEYFHTSQLTEKSDVYSFGVVLTELLTGQKALCFERPESDRNLAMYFASSMRKDRLIQIIDDKLVKEENIEQMRVVANIAKRCVGVRGEDRPTMKEVAAELEGLKPEVITLNLNGITHSQEHQLEIMIKMIEDSSM